MRDNQRRLVISDSSESIIDKYTRDYLLNGDMLDAVKHYLTAVYVNDVELAATQKAQHDQPTQVPSYQANPASSMVIKDHVLDIDKSINSYIGFSRLPNTANTVFAITYADLGLFNHYGFEASAGLRSYVVDLVPGEIVMIEGVPHTVLSLDRAFYNSDNAIDDLNRAKASLGASTSFQTCNDSTGLNLTIAYLS